MTREDFVRPETAEMLSEVGFDGECAVGTLPTLQTAAKWLRYERDVSVEAISTKSKGVERCYRVFVNSNVTEQNADFDTYEAALEYGIVKALKTLKKGDSL